MYTCGAGLLAEAGMLAGAGLLAGGRYSCGGRSTCEGKYTCGGKYSATAHISGGWYGFGGPEMSAVAEYSSTSILSRFCQITYLNYDYDYGC